MSDGLPTPGKLRLDSAEAFFNALRAPEITMRLAVLRAVMANPRLALGFGRYEGKDVIDVLIDQAMGKHGFSYWQIVVATLAAFDDPRVVSLYRKLLVTWDRPDVLAMVVARLEREPVAELGPTVRALLMQDKIPAQASAAADLLRLAADLTPAEAVRVSVANTRGADVAGPVTPDSAPQWIAELAGYYAGDARYLLESRGEEAVTALASAWDALRPADRAWLLGWSASASPLAAIPLLRRGLESSDRETVAAALRTVATFEEGTRLFVALVSPHAQRDDAEIRRLAIQAGATGLDWRKELEISPDPAYTCAVLLRLAEAEGVEAAGALAGLLSHTDWTVRATATEALKGFGAPAVPFLRATLQAAATPEARVAATAALADLGDVEWLEEHLFEPSS